MYCVLSWIKSAKQSDKIGFSLCGLSGLNLPQIEVMVVFVSCIETWVLDRQSFQFKVKLNVFETLKFYRIFIKFH